MTTQEPPSDDVHMSSIMERVKRGQNAFELMSVRFHSFSASYMNISSEGDPQARIGIQNIQVTEQTDGMNVSMHFEFLSPSPFEEEPHKQVSVDATIVLHYSLDDKKSPDTDDIDAFARVNGIYNAWPYLREHLRTSLVRLDLPPFELPLLRVGAAVQLANLPDTTSSRDLES